MIPKSYLQAVPASSNEINYSLNVISNILVHTLNVFLIADKKITARQLYDFLDTAWREYDPQKLEEDNLHNRTIRLAAECEFTLRSAYHESDSVEVMNRNNGSAAFKEYLADFDKNVPENNLLRSASAFHGKERLELDKGLQAVTDLAFYGFLLMALSNPNFATLCKNKDLDTSSMTFEQKMDEELDHEALYRYLQDKLGTA